MNKRFAVKIFILFILLAVFASCFASFAQNETIFSADFNSDYDGFSFEAYNDNPEVTVFSYVGEGGPDGSGCVKIESNEPNDARFIKSVKLTKGKTYLISADIKLESVSGSNPAGINLSVYSLYSDGFTFFTEPGEWKTAEQYFKTDVTGDYNICLRLGYFSRDTGGAAYFDNVKLIQVDSAPKGVSVAKINQEQEQSQQNNSKTGAKYTANTYYDMRIVSIITVIFSFIIFGIWYVYTKKSENNPDFKPFEASFNRRITFISVLSAALIIRLVLSVTYYQCDIDVNLFKYWGNVGRQYGVSKIYKIAGNCDYPPLYLYFLTLFSVLSGGNNVIFTVFVKLLPIICDLIIGYIVFKFALSKGHSDSSAIFFSSIWLFNPVVLLDSACWGQVDSILTLLVLLTALFIEKKNYLFAGLFFGLGVMLKPQMIIFLPVCGAAFLFDFANEVSMKKTSSGFKKLGFTILGIIIGLFVPTIPFLGMGTAECTVFGIKMNLPWIFSLFAGTVDHYAYATVNCYNFWFLLGKNWTGDGEKAGLLTYYQWGMLAIVLFSLLCLFVFAFCFYKNTRGRVKGSDSEKGVGNLIYPVGAMLYLCVSCFGPRMHERYFFPAVALLLISFIVNRDKLSLLNYAFVSGVGYISVHEIMLGILCGGSIMDSGGAFETYGDLYWPKMNLYRGIVSSLVIVGSLAAVVIVVKLLIERKTKK